MRAINLSVDSQGRRMDGWKALERWESDRMQQPISLARWGHYGGAGAGVPDCGR